MAPWALIVGGRRTGKTSVAKRVIQALRVAGFTAGGVVQEAVEEDGERVAYEAVRLAHPEERVIVARRGPPRPGEEAVCSFSFDDEAFARVRAWLAEDACEVVIVDEVSKAESRGRGHAAAIDVALQGATPVVLCVRADELVPVMDRFVLGEPIAVIDTSAPDVDRFVQAVASHVKRP